MLISGLSAAGCWGLVDGLIDCFLAMKRILHVKRYTASGFTIFKYGALHVFFGTLNNKMESKNAQFNIVHKTEKTET